MTRLGEGDEIELFEDEEDGKESDCSLLSFGGGAASQVRKKWNMLTESYTLR